MEGLTDNEKKWNHSAKFVTFIYYHQAKHMIAPISLKQCRWIWLNGSHKSTTTSGDVTRKHTTTNPVHISCGVMYPVETGECFRCSQTLPWVPRKLLLKFYTVEWKFGATIYHWIIYIYIYIYTYIYIYIYIAWLYPKCASTTKM